MNLSYNLKLPLVLLLSICCLSYSKSQSVEINFEDIPNETEIEGLKINTQFFDDYGITFSLENGESPTLAEVGSPATAFLSSLGDDTPIGTSDVGQFFITDDGSLSGLASSALIINFTDPITYAIGQILDVDFTESFTIEAFGINDELLFIETLEDGDPGTGDGLATEWSIGTDYCFEIYKLRLEGTRTQAGEFGLGIDNFVFFPTVKIENVITEDTDCGLANGTLDIITNITDGIQYSINGIDFYNSSVFENLESDSYTVYVKENDNCTDDTEVFINDNSYNSYNVKVFSATCGNEDGIIDVQNNNNAIITLNNEVKVDPYIDNLKGGDYILSFEDENGCILDTLINVFIIDCTFYIPNTISPNNDGINDDFTISTHKDFDGEFVSILIYDRWGSLVFEANDFKASEMRWDGNFNNVPCNSGIYPYVLIYNSYNGKQNTKNGIINVIK